MRGPPLQAPQPVQMDRGGDNTLNGGDEVASRDEETQEPPRKRQHGGRRVDQDGNTLGGRPSRKQKLVNYAKTTGMLTMQEFQRRAPELKRKREEREDREAAERAVEAAKRAEREAAAQAEREAAERAEREAEESLNQGEGLEDALPPGEDFAPAVIYDAADDIDQGCTDGSTTAAAPLVAHLESKLRDLSIQLTRRVEEVVSHGVERLKSEVASERENAVAAIDRAYDKAADKIADLQGLRQANTQCDIVHNEQTAINCGGRVFCVVCTENVACLRDGRQLRSRWLASNNGYEQDKDLVKHWNAHVESHMHQLCVAAAADRAAEPMVTAIQKEHERRDAVMRLLFMLVAHIDKEKKSHRSYERALLLLHLVGLDVGDCEHSRITCREMSVLMAEHARSQLREFLRTENDITGRLPHIGTSVDKETDNGKMQSQMQMFRVNFNGTPLTVFGSLKPLDLEYDTEHEANGYCCFQKLVEGVEELGVQLFEVLERNEDGEPIKYGDSILPHGHSEQYRTTAADGEACYNGSGPERSVRARLLGDHGLGDRTHIMTHDPAHSADLMVGDAHKTDQYVMGVIHPTIKEIYAHYSRSPHKHRHMMALVEKWGAADLFRQIHHLFEVRFVASEFVALSNFLASFVAIHEALGEELKTDDITPEMKTKITGWRRKMKQFKFVAYLIVMVDIHTVNKVFSARVQSDAALIIDVPSYRESYRLDLEKLRVSLGAEACRRLESLKVGKLVMADADEANPNRVLRLRGAGGDDEVGEDEEDEEDDEEEFLEAEEDAVVGELDLAASTGDVKARLLGYQQQFVDALLSTFESRIQNHRVAVLLRKVFDFRRMPLQQQASDAAVDALLSWGDAELEELCSTYFPELDVEVVKDEALAMRVYVRDNAGGFLRDKDPTDLSKGKVLALTGPGSIFQSLFARSDVCSKVIPHILHIADYMIAFMWQSCNGERAASHLNLVKSKERVLLGDETFDSIVFNTYNMPELHEINFDPIIAKWIKEGRKSGAVKGAPGDSTESNSRVIRRHLAKTKATFLFK